MDRIEPVEIRVGPATLTEVYGEPSDSTGSRPEAWRLTEEATAWEENLRERWRRDARRKFLYRLLAGVATGAAAMAALVWLLRGL